MNTATGKPRLRARRAPAPIYPKSAGDILGVVVVGFTVNPNGGVDRARVVRGNPPRVFDASALAAVRSWQFEAPGRSVRTTRTFRFAP